ncbi:hypothetical protein C0991_003774 [Blastosporella zonata]|nr:hypothetical protein C0991_003774 [Blastosporella zonata]
MILALPPELVEETLVIAAALGFPAAIAAFGCTCRHFNRLVYHTADNHLWRQVFLTTFDDPRQVLRRIGNATTTGPVDDDMDVMYDWAEGFQSRVKAARLFRELDRTTPKVFDLLEFAGKPQDTSVPLTSTLATIISVLETAAPFPPHHTEPMTPGTSFPPLVTLHASPMFTSKFTSLNTIWVNKILKHGYPPSLVKKYLLAGHQPSKPLKVTEEPLCGYPEEGQLFHRLVFRKGFVPTLPSVEVPWKTLQSAEDQSVAAREVARSKVYNLRYLRPERSWGPFLPPSAMCDSEAKPKPSTTFPDFEQELSSYISNYIVDDVSDSDDEDFEPAEDEDDETDDGVPQVVRLSFGRRQFDPKFVMPRPHEVVPDYAYLAAARMLVEMNLREALIMGQPESAVAGAGSIDKIIDALACLDFGRMGGVPAFWENSWVDLEQHFGPEDGQSIPPTSPSTGRDRKGKGKATDVEWIQGWDWAGAAGHWVRVVCWLDYRDLFRAYTPSLFPHIAEMSWDKTYLVHNLHGYNGDDMGETIHFFPMELRISGYSRPPEPAVDKEALVWKLPVIHLEGDSRGSDSDSQIIRKVRGTVRMLKDGAIRWSLTSSYPNEDAPEWASESIQVGSIGSTLGILGMWTGAEHNNTDPLGPAWSWKVA